LVVIKFRPQAKVDPVRLVKVVQEYPGVTLVPPVSLKLDLEAAGTGNLKVSGYPKGVAAAPKGTGSPKGGSRRPSGLRDAEQTSWWTARATAGEVKAGFTKEEMLRRPEADPRAAGGMFSRLEGLLAALR
jgi:hypothetical protein